MVGVDSWGQTLLEQEEMSCTLIKTLLCCVFISVEFIGLESTEKAMKARICLNEKGERALETF